MDTVYPNKNYQLGHNYAVDDIQFHKGIESL
jgi:hypothetical protein